MASVQITVRNVPTWVRDELAARAARQGKSMQEYLRQELARLSESPSSEMLLEKIRERKARSGVALSVDELLDARDADRR